MSAVLSNAEWSFDLQAVLRAITYKDWSLYYATDEAGREYIRWKFEAQCAKSGMPMSVSGRRWWLSPHMTESEIVQTALLAALTAEEHEARESFRYHGKRVFNPHVSVRRLFEVCEDEDARDGF